MRISELARSSGVPVATIKYYLREGLLHEGKRTSATQARYDETHLARLRLVRALAGPGGLSIAVAREVLAAIEDPPPSVHDLLGVAQQAVGRQPPGGEEVDLAEVHALLRRWGWRVDPEDCATHAELARALAALDAAQFPLPPGVLDVYAEAMSTVATAEVAAVPTESPDAAVRYVVLGTVLVEPVLLALRRLAQQDASARRFEPTDASAQVGSTLER